MTPSPNSPAATAIPVRLLAQSSASPSPPESLLGQTLNAGGRGLCFANMPEIDIGFLCAGVNVDTKQLFIEHSFAPEKLLAQFLHSDRKTYGRNSDISIVYTTPYTAVETAGERFEMSSGAMDDHGAFPATPENLRRLVEMTNSELWEALNAKETA